MSKLVGFKRFTGKNGKDYCVANVVSAYSARDNERGCIGQKVEEIFMPEKLNGLLNNSHVGHDLQLEYEFSGNRAYLINVTVK